jgi:hypothetical protein
MIRRGTPKLPSQNGINSTIVMPSIRPPLASYTYFDYLQPDEMQFSATFLFLSLAFGKPGMLLDHLSLKSLTDLYSYTKR